MLLEPRLAAVLEPLAEAVTVQGSDGRTIYANRAALDLLGLSELGELIGGSRERIRERFLTQHEDGRPFDPAEFPGTRLLRGEPAEPLLVRNVVRATGEERWLLSKATPLRDADGEIEFVVNLIEDVTTAKRGELRARFLAQVGETLAGSLDYRETLANVASLAVPEIADWCAVDLIDGEERSTVAVAHVDPDKLELAARLRAYDPPELDPEQGIGLVVASGRAQLYPELPDRLLVEGAHDEEHLRLLRAVGMRSALIVPMATPSAMLGALTLVNAESGRSFTTDDVVFAEDIARRAALAVENARLFTERGRIARTLQESLLPDALPQVPGWQLSALFRPAGGGAEIGGDFYDAFPTRGGWLVVVGDVTGKGVEAATLTALVRHSLRVICEYEHDPAAVVARLNTLLLAHGGLHTCTLVAALLEAGAVTCVSAGHPLPLVAGPGGTRRIGSPGLMLGAFGEGEWPVERHPLGEGETLVLYTDGVTDSRAAGGERFGYERLVGLLAQDAALDPPALIARLAGALEAFQADEQADDTAAIVARRLGPVR